MLISYPAFSFRFTASESISSKKKSFRAEERDSKLGQQLRERPPAGKMFQSREIWNDSRFGHVVSPGWFWKIENYHNLLRPNRPWITRRTHFWRAMIVVICGSWAVWVNDVNLDRLHSGIRTLAIGGRLL